MVAALYTKQTAAIIALPLVVALVLWRGRKALLSRHLWLIAVVATLALVPLGYIQLKFGSFSIMAAVDRPDVSIDRTSLSGIAWYARHLPAMLGLPIAALSVVYLIGCAVRRDWWPANGDSLVHGCWLGLTYVSLTAIDVKDTRTKQTAAIIALPLVVALVLWRGRKALLSRHLWLIAVVATLALVPLGYIQLKFGSFSIMAAVDRPDVSIDRTSLSGIAWYARHLPAMLGLPIAALSVVYLIGCAVRRDWWPANGDSLVHGCWLGLTYVSLTAIDVKDTRFGLILLVPLVVAAALALDRLAPNRAVRQIAPVLALALFISTLANNPTPAVSGYREAANRVAESAPEGTRVVFAGNRDGSFIFNLRAHKSRRDLSVVRADKLFLGIAIMPSLGLNPKDFSKDQIASMLNRYGVSYVVTVAEQEERRPYREGEHWDIEHHLLPPTHGFGHRQQHQRSGQRDRRRRDTSCQRVDPRSKDSEENTDTSHCGRVLTDQ